MNPKIENYLTTARNELVSNILPFYPRYTLDKEMGGFYGLISNDCQPGKDHPKGLVYYARMLWSYAAASQFLGNSEYKYIADIAYQYFYEKFWDKNHGGFYWTLNYDGTPLSDLKKVYGQAFALYAIAEYYAAWPDPEVLKNAQVLFALIDEKTRDTVNKGNFETYFRDWKISDDRRLSDSDMDSDKSMNTHLHLFEAYANLYRVWPDALLKSRLQELLEITLDKIIHPQTNHFIMFFNKTWQPESSHVSYGHDIEGSWLLCEAAHILNDPAILQRAEAKAVLMADAVLQQGFDVDGAIPYEVNGTTILDPDKHWWVQAEAAVGFLNAYEISHEEKFLNAFFHCWDLIENKFIDRIHGEWFLRITPDGQVADDPKVYEWKGPYHNSRSCMEICRRLEKIKSAQ